MAKKHNSKYEARMAARRLANGTDPAPAAPKTWGEAYWEYYKSLQEKGIFPLDELDARKEERRSMFPKLLAAIRAIHGKHSNTWTPEERQVSNLCSEIFTTQHISGSLCSDFSLMCEWNRLHPEYYVEHNGYKCSIIVSPTLELGWSPIRAREWQHGFPFQFDNFEGA